MVCKIVADFQNQCVAIANNASATHTQATGFGWAVAPTSDAAKQQALAQCHSMTKGQGQAC
ncbi:MAG: DUF4189 domain-containing protein, partial [Candidatus Bathyarchaeia archaeon]